MDIYVFINEDLTKQIAGDHLYEKVLIKINNLYDNHLRITS